MHSLSVRPHQILHAQVAGDELERIRRANGDRLEAKQVVVEARPPGAPLHDMFTWDDSEAAEQFRLREARTLIRSVRILVGGSKSEPAYVNVKIEDAQYYQSTRVAIRNKDEWQSALRGVQANVAAAQQGVVDLLGMVTNPRKQERLKNARRAIRAAGTAVGHIAA